MPRRHWRDLGPDSSSDDDTSDTDSTGSWVRESKGDRDERERKREREVREGLAADRRRHLSSESRSHHHRHSIPESRRHYRVPPRRDFTREDVETERQVGLASLHAERESAKHTARLLSDHVERTTNKDWFTKETARTQDNIHTLGKSQDYPPYDVDRRQFWVEAELELQEQVDFYEYLTDIKHHGARLPSGALPPSDSVRGKWSVSQTSRDAEKTDTLRMGKHSELSRRYRGRAPTVSSRGRYPEAYPLIGDVQDANRRDGRTGSIFNRLVDGSYYGDVLIRQPRLRYSRHHRWTEEDNSDRRRRMRSSNGETRRNHEDETRPRGDRYEYGREDDITDDWRRRRSSQGDDRHDGNNDYDDRPRVITKVTRDDVTVKVNMPSRQSSASGRSRKYRDV